MTTIQMKAKLDVEGLKRVQQLVQDLKKHLNIVETLVGQINSSTIQIEVSGPTVSTISGRDLKAVRHNRKG